MPASPLPLLLLLPLLVGHALCVHLVSLQSPPPAVFSGLSADATRHLPAIVGAHGYRAETYHVRTSDGYILTLYRIRPTIAGGARPVLLMHGLLLSAECFVDAGPESGLAYSLADAGRDVWVGNQRGSYHGRRHRRLDPDSDPAFWRFSYHEMGVYDLSAIVDRITAATGADAIDYVGYSEGGAAFFILCSERPDYQRKFNVAVMLAPSSRMRATRSPLFRSFATAASNLGDGELMPRLYLRGVGALLDALEPHHAGSVARRTLRAIEGHFPAGTSVRTVAHFAQALRSDDFLAYDHGALENVLVYGSERPPAYNLSAVLVPVALVSARGDRIVDVRDVSWLARRLPRLLRHHTLQHPRWNHFDFAYSRLASAHLLPLILKYINNATHP